MKYKIKVNSLAYLFALGILGTQIGCSSDKKNDTTSTTQESAGDSETAYNEFKDYVSSVENSTTDRTDSVNWAKASASSKAEYDAKVARMDEYADQYDESRRQEIDQLKSRYSTYWGIDGSSTNGGIATSTRNALADFDTNEIGTTSAGNIRRAYENFVTLVASNKDRYTKSDWQAAERYFRSLDDRKNAVQSQLTGEDKVEIAKAKAKYTAIKAGRLGIDASEAANTASDDANQVGSEIKEETKSGANKVGNAAEKAGSQIKSTVKSGAKKIDRKIDDNPNVD